MAMIYAGCALKPSWQNNTTGSPITWSFVEDSEHGPIFFTGVQQSGPFIEILYPQVTKIHTFLVGVDETLQKYMVVAGATVGMSSSRIIASTIGSRAYFLTGNGTDWSSAPLTNTVSNGSTTIGGITTLTNSYAYGTVGQYMGTNPYVVRPNLTSIAVGQWKFDLINMTTGQKVTTPPTTDDKVLITAPMAFAPISLWSFDGEGMTKRIFEANTAPATSTGNLCVFAIFEV
jgi:hypothetical protein